MSTSTRTRARHRIAGRLPRGARAVRCAVHGHRWDVAPSFRRDSRLECVRCGLRAEAVGGAGPGL